MRIKLLFVHFYKQSGENESSFQTDTISVCLKNAVCVIPTERSDEGSQFAPCIVLLF